MQYFPLFIDTSRLNVLIVGAGEVACRKLDLLARTDADIYVVAPDVCDEVADYAADTRILLARRKVQSRDFHEMDLVYIATDDSELNQQLADDARELGCWVNVVDDPENCDFISPSIVDRGKLVVAISTAGTAPVFAREIRARLETLLPASLTSLLDFVAAKRQDVQQRLPDIKSRRYFWERFFQLNGERFDGQTVNRYERCFSDASHSGELLLLQTDTPVSLLPLAAIPMLQRLELILLDEAAAADLLELVRRDASRTLESWSDSELLAAWESGQRLLRVSHRAEIERLKAAFPFARHLRPGAL